MATMLMNCVFQHLHFPYPNINYTDLLEHLEHSEKLYNEIRLDELSEDQLTTAIMRAVVVLNNPNYDKTKLANDINLIFINVYMLMKRGLSEKYGLEINAIGIVNGGHLICDQIELFKDKFKNSSIYDGINNKYIQMYKKKEEIKEAIKKNNLPKEMIVKELKVCAVCVKPSKNKCKCGVKYCGTECQHIHWQEHKKVCCKNNIKTKCGCKIIRNSKEHNECRSDDNGENWICGDCYNGEYDETE